MFRQPKPRQASKSQSGIALIEVTLVLPLFLLLLAMIVDVGRVFYEVSLLQGRMFSAARYIAMHVPISTGEGCKGSYFNNAKALALTANGHGNNPGGRFNSFKCEKHNKQDHWQVSAKYNANFIFKDLLPDSLSTLTVNVFAIHRATL